MSMTTRRSFLQYPHAQAVIMGSWNWPFGRKDMEVYGATGYAITVAADQIRIRHEHDSEEQTTTAPALPARRARFACVSLRGASRRD